MMRIDHEILVSRRANGVWAAVDLTTYKVVAEGACSWDAELEAQQLGYWHFTIDTASDTEFVKAMQNTNYHD